MAKKKSFLEELFTGGVISPEVYEKIFPGKGPGPRVDTPVAAAQPSPTASGIASTGEFSATVGEIIAQEKGNEGLLEHLGKTGELPEETARREFLEQGGTIAGDPGLDPITDPNIPFKTPFLPFGEQPVEPGRDALEGFAFTGDEEDPELKKQPSASDRRKQYAIGLQQMGHGLGQWQQSTQSLSPQEGIGGMANFVGGYIQMVTADSRNSEMWGKFGTVLGIIGTWMNLRGQRESARRTSNYRRDLTNSVALALRNAGSLG